jgi:hypothetical protein
VLFFYVSVVVLGLVGLLRLLFLFSIFVRVTVGCAGGIGGVVTLAVVVVGVVFILVREIRPRHGVLPSDSEIGELGSGIRKRRPSQTARTKIEQRRTKRPHQSKRLYTHSTNTLATTNHDSSSAQLHAWHAEAFTATQHRHAAQLNMHTKHSKRTHSTTQHTYA